MTVILFKVFTSRRRVCETLVCHTHDFCLFWFCLHSRSDLHKACLLKFSTLCSFCIVLLLQLIFFCKMSKKRVTKQNEMTWFCNWTSHLTSPPFFFLPSWISSIWMVCIRAHQLSQTPATDFLSQKTWLRTSRPCPGSSPKAAPKWQAFPQGLTSISSEDVSEGEKRLWVRFETYV